MPAVTRPLINDDSNSANGADDGEHGASHRACSVDLILDTDETDTEVIKFLERGEQVAGGAREPIEFPNKDAIHLTIADAGHQRIERGTAVPPPPVNARFCRQPTFRQERRTARFVLTGR